MSPRAGQPRPRRPRAGFLIGVLLMAASFLVYPAYPVLVFLPVSASRRAQATVGATGLSWGLFAIGLYVAGRRGWVWLRRRWKARRREPPPPGPVFPAS